MPLSAKGPRARALKRKPVRKGLCGAIRCSCMACDLGGHAIRSFYSARVVGQATKGAGMCRQVLAWTGARAYILTYYNRRYHTTIYDASHSFCS